ncbi:hypothetical protein GCM10011515_17920 [Tsuneonella deserti]|uniref:Bacterial dipeptidyl-peptidase SH3 domain-containing protein n=1 Tax=Tsuneonella deserti TaxID=2035528 RepID=A0ABQ1S8L9_9SPHN|nr:hypothetical protein [Tsuneonella deserti]GGD98499.1 hypothetical protein GCM10011515_17920 [Tsuneonella deserti]
MTETGKYHLPEGQLSLSGPVVRPAIGTLPIRGDLAHIALADKYFVANYVMPQLREIGPAGAALLCLPRDGADEVTRLDAGAMFEALDYSGDWCWGCLGPQGPSGYLRIAELAPRTGG